MTIDDGIRGAASSRELGAAMSRWTTRGARQWITAAIAGAVGALAHAAGASAALITELVLYGTLAFLLVRFVERRRRRVFLEYELSPEEAARFQGVDDALRELASGGVMHGVQDVTRHDDWKRNAGTSATVRSEKGRLGRTPLPAVATNLRPWSVSFDGRQLMFLPDGLLIWRRHGEFTVCPYRELEVSSSTEDLVWGDALPSGATIVGQRWRYIRVDGGPDRRFAHNYQIPVVRTGCLLLHGPDGLAEILQSTSPSAVRRVAHELHAVVENARAMLQVSMKKPGELAEALAVFGFDRQPSLEELEQKRRELEGGGRPGSFDLVILSPSRQATIEAAHELLREHLRGASEGREVDRPAAQAALDFSSRAPVAGWRSAERWMSFAVGLLALLVFAGARGVKANQERRAERPTVVAQPAPAFRPATTAPVAVGKVVIDCPLRAKPSSNARKLAHLDRNAEVILLESRSGWRKVRAGDGSEGWTGPKCWQVVAKAPPRRAAPARRAAQKVEVVEPLSSGEGAVAAAVDPTGASEAEAMTPEPATGAAPAKGSPLDQLTEEEKVRLEELDLE